MAKNSYYVKANQSY